MNVNVDRSEQRAERIARLIAELANHDSVVRKHARETLCRMDGHDVTRALVGELVDPRRLVRWEAVKALSVLADPIAAPGLLHAMEDDDGDVRWVAAEGLIRLGHTGLLTVLSGLTRRARSIEFCRSAHHVLHDLKKHGHADVIAPVLAALERPEPQVAAPLAAHQALLALKCHH